MLGHVDIPTAHDDHDWPLSFNLPGKQSCNTYRSCSLNDEPFF
ncbi:hypothetical protein DW66_1184 [Pseudomonas putida]|nr:hypothetical protein DW66_1184 [Pseudomonas putida]